MEVNIFSFAKLFKMLCLSFREPLPNKHKWCLS